MYNFVYKTPSLYLDLSYPPKPSRIYHLYAHVGMSYMIYVDNTHILLSLCDFSLLSSPISYRNLFA